MNLDFLRVAAVVPQVNVADCKQNVKNIISDCERACESGAKIAVFPELSVTAYTCGDLFNQSLLQQEAENGLLAIKNASNSLDCMIVVGAPLRIDTNLYNCAVVIAKGRFIGVVPKTYLSNSKGEEEKRWFESGNECPNSHIRIGNETVPFGNKLMFVQDNVKIAIEIGDDLWTAIPPSSIATLRGANIILNISALNELSGKYDSLINILKVHSSRCKCGYVYSSAGYGESTTDLVFGGNAIVVENGTVLRTSERFSLDGSMSIADIDVECLIKERCNDTVFFDCAKIHVTEYIEIPIENVCMNAGETNSLLRPLHRQPFLPVGIEKMNELCEDIVNIQVNGLIKRLKFTGMKYVVIGISGGLDSTLALLVSYKAFEKMGYDYKGIVGITMPGFGTTDRTYTNALNLMSELGITQKEISIKKSVLQHFEDIEHDVNIHNVTYENAQARERTQILMDYANKCGGLVIGTGDLSELALGWATYNGDHMSMYGVNAGVPKTLVKHLVRWFALKFTDSIKTILSDIVDTPISPELIPADENGKIKQKTEDLVGPYELHDFFIYYALRYGFSPYKIFYLAKKTFVDDYSEIEIKKWLKSFYKRFFMQQFKRSCMPDGPKVVSVGLSPRGDWRMPSDACAKLWIEECDRLL